MKIGAIVQARMGSSRLPGKVLLDLSGKTVLWHVYQRISQSKFIDEIVIATTEKEIDNDIISEADRYGYKYYRGSEDDVLMRYYYAALEHDLDVIVRITSDCPLIDPKVIDNIICLMLDNNYEVATNAGNEVERRTFPRGLDTEVFTFRMLEEAFNEAKEDYQREHVTPYIYENEKNVFYYLNKIDYSNYRLTLDTKEDYFLIKEIYKNLYRGKHDFYLDDIINLLIEKNELTNINKNVEQKKIKNN